MEDAERECTNLQYACSDEKDSGVWVEGSVCSYVFLDARESLLLQGPKAIVYALTWSLQARNWEGKQLWTVDIEQCGPGKLSVADESVFIWNSGAIQEFNLVTG